MNPRIVEKTDTTRSGVSVWLCCTGYGAFRKTSTADAVARSFLLTPDFAVGKSSFFRRFDEPIFCFRKNEVHESPYRRKNGHNPLGCVRIGFVQGYGALPHFSNAAGVLRKIACAPDFTVRKG